MHRPTSSSKWANKGAKIPCWPCFADWNKASAFDFAIHRMGFCICSSKCEKSLVHAMANAANILRHRFPLLFPLDPSELAQIKTNCAEVLFDSICMCEHYSTRMLRSETINGKIWNKNIVSFLFICIECELQPSNGNRLNSVHAWLRTYQNSTLSLATHACICRWCIFFGKNLFSNFAGSSASWVFLRFSPVCRCLGREKGERRERETKRMDCRKAQRAKEKERKIETKKGVRATQRAERKENGQSERQEVACSISIFISTLIGLIALLSRAISWSTSNQLTTLLQLSSTTRC